MKHPGRVIAVAMIAVGVLAASAVVLAPSDGKRADCRASLESPAGAFPSLAAVDEEGYVLPFSRVNLDGTLVYRTDLVRGEGLQNREFRFVMSEAAKLQLGFM